MFVDSADIIGVVLTDLSRLWLGSGEMVERGALVTVQFVFCLSLAWLCRGLARILEIIFQDIMRNATWRASRANQFGSIFTSVNVNNYRIVDDGCCALLAAFQANTKWCGRVSISESLVDCFAIRMQISLDIYVSFYLRRLARTRSSRDNPPIQWSGRWAIWTNGSVAQLAGTSLACWWRPSFAKRPALQAAEQCLQWRLGCVCR